MNENRIVIIGIGALMEKLMPCFENLLGGDIEKNLIATTADEGDVDRKRQIFPFEIVVGDNTYALDKMRPDIIVFAVPPQVAMEVTEKDLVPYYEKCRAADLKIPVLYVFPPRPAADFYLGKLGADLEVCHILPNVILSIGGKKLENEGLNFITVSDDSVWNEADRETLEKFMSATGHCIYLHPSKVMTIMTSGVGVINYAFVLETMSCALKEAGYEADINTLAEAARYALSKYTGLEVTSDVPGRTCLPDEIFEAVSGFTVKYYDGLRRYCSELGLDDETAKEFVDRYFDFYLHFYMSEPESSIKGLVASQTTKGGVAEKGEIVYRENMKDRLYSVFSQIGKKTPDDLFYKEVEEYILDCSKQVLAHGASMGKKK